MDIELEIRWEELTGQLEKKFGEVLEVEKILFLIGVQELGQGYRKYSKDEKVALMHVAICTLLSNYGYYEFIGVDEDLWPHWKSTKKLPHLSDQEQKKLMKKAIIEYFEEKN